jgi:hypothetical protein
MMNDLTQTIDFARVAAALLSLYIVLPLAARRMGDAPPAPWWSDIVPSFISASLFYEVTATILGGWRLCFAGLMAFLVLCWLAVTIAFASKRRWIWETAEWRARFLRLLEWLEAGTWRRLLGRIGTVPDRIRWTGSAMLAAVLVVCALVERTGFAFDNLRFLGSETYQRALSLETLVAGGAWQWNGPVALVAPLAHFSGAGGSTVVRFAGPLFTLLLAVAAGYCAWVYSRRFSAAYLACGLLALYPSRFGLDSLGEPAGAEMACVFWILAVAELRKSWKYAVMAAAVALMLHQQFTPVLAASLLAILLALLLSSIAIILPGFLTMPARVGAAALFVALLMRPLRLPAEADGPFQYESSARVAARIAREFPRNRWLIVSPAQELHATYGRGWHVELSEFVREYSPAELNRPRFRFPYSVDDLFVIVEKEPLRQPARDAAMADDDYSYQYFTQIGRTTLEFEAAQLMAAYTAAHSDTSVYYENEQIIVYRIQCGN